MLFSFNPNPKGSRKKHLVSKDFHVIHSLPLGSGERNGFKRSKSSPPFKVGEKNGFRLGEFLSLLGPGEKNGLNYTFDFFYNSGGIV